MKIFTKKNKIIISSLLLTSNLVFPASVLAIDIPEVPTIPTAPSVPVVTYTIPPVNQVPPVPTVPAAPTAPKPITSQNSNTTGNSQPVDVTGNSVVNSDNGSGSKNNSSASSTNDTSVVNVNDANVVNNQDVDVKTGNNDANKNMGTGTVQSGNASVSSGLITDINNNTITIGDLCGLGCSADFVAANLQNGNGTLNNADGSLTNLVLLNNANNLNLANNINLLALTGKNEASKNMGEGVIVSGDADVVFTTINFGNNNGINASVVDYNIVDNQSADLWINFPTGTASGSGLGSLGAMNVGNGVDSTNTSSANSSNTLIIDNNNNLVLTNDINLKANTGDNTADKNMGSGNITTGDANIASNVINFLNNNIVAGAKWLISTVNIFGDMSGNIILPREADLTGCGCSADLTAINSGNGADSTNNANTSVTDTTLLNNINNATVVNNINLDATTGGNNADKNMGDSSISTGETNVESNLVTIANTNAVGQGDTWYLVIINNNGTYTGQIMGAKDGATIAGSGLDFGVSQGGTVYALNSGNGADSINNANTSSDNTTIINNINNAQIDNNINIDANTGGNSASGNMGGANIKTGDVNVLSNIVNFVNNNFIGSKFVVTIVNIFGSFSGKIITPDQPLPTTSGIGSANIPVSLTNNTSITGKESNKPKAKYSSAILSDETLGSLSSALQESGKILENAAVTQKDVNDSVKKIVNNGTQKSTFEFNFVLLGIAFLVLAIYAYISRRKASY